MTLIHWASPWYAARVTPRQLVARIAVRLVCALVLLMPSLARAEAPGSHALAAAVLALDSDTALAHADALTHALRSEIGRAEGWSIVETSQTLVALTTAFGCEARPSVKCQEQIGDQLRVDRYLWGTVSKGPGAQVTAEIHLFQRGKSDVVVSESYSDNLKDQNDDALKAVATKILGGFSKRVLGRARIESTRGEVAVINAGKQVRLEGGKATVLLPVGAHNIEVRAAGRPSEKRTVTVPAGDEVFVVIADAAPPAEEAQGHAFPWHPVLGWSAIVGGTALAVVGGVYGAQWMGLRSDIAGLRDQYPAGADACAVATRYPAADEACRKNEQAQSKSIGWVFAGAGVALIGTGTVLLLTGGGSDDDASKSKAKAQLSPFVGRGGGGAALSGTF